MVVVLTSAEPAVVADPLQVHTHVLANGLTVMVSVQRERPEVFGAVVVRTGARNDPPDDTGMAHYLEHMLFKGTQRLGTTDWAAEAPLQVQLEVLYDRKRAAPADAQAEIDREIAATVQKTYAYAVPNELDQLLGELGGTGINAFTTYDETVYHNTFPASQVDAWLDLYAERFRDPVFRLFPTELEAVYEEKNSAIDVTGYELFRSFMRGAFPDHPYGRNDILGEVEHLKRPSLRAMRTYFERYYVPSNMALVLAGDVDVAVVLPKIEAAFGTWQPGPDPAPPEYAIAPFARDQRLRTRSTPVRVGAIAYRTVPESHPDYPALLVARRLLTNDQRTGLIDRLADDGRLLYAMYIPAELVDTNLDVVAYLPRLISQTFRGAERLVTRQFQRIRDGDFDDRSFLALKAGLLVAETTRWESNRERALAMARAFVVHGSWDGHKTQLQRLAAVTRADVQRVAATYFGEQRLVVRSRAGYPKKVRLNKPSVPPVTPSGAHSQYFSQQRARPRPAARVPFVEPTRVIHGMQLREDVHLQVNTNPQNDLYHLELRFGSGTDDLRQVELLAEYLPRIGSTRFPGAALRQRLFELSTTLTASAELDRLVVRLQGPQEHMEAALTVLGDLMAAPEAERRPLRQLRRETWALRRYARKNPSSVGKALRDYVLYGDNAPERRSLGPGGARRTSPSALLAAWKSVQQHALQIGYVGRASPDAVASAVARRLPLPPATKPAVADVVYPRQVPSETTVYFIPRRDAVQTQLWFAVEGDPLQPHEHAAADAFSEYFGGSMAGLVFQEVREFRALAYAAHARYIRDRSPEQRGMLLGHVACQADKTFDALDVMVELITDMPARSDRLELVRSTLLRSQETASPSFRDVQSRVREWQRMGYADDPRRELVPAYERLEFADIVAFYRKHLAGRPLAIMVVGDPRKASPEKLRKYGKLVRLRERQLYSH